MKFVSCYTCICKYVRTYMYNVRTYIHILTNACSVCHFSVTCPVSLPHSSTEPINIFHGIYKTDNAPIRLSYHQNVHYNSVIDPYEPSVGVGLGLAGYKPGVSCVCMCVCVCVCVCVCMCVCEFIYVRTFGIACSHLLVPKTLYLYLLVV